MSYETPEILELGEVAEMTLGLPRGNWTDGGARTWRPLVEDQEE
jgi:predicted 2-oxoglutarate/Fe(II)-dependent dioxygenase YbiX